MVNEWIPVSSGLLPEDEGDVQVTYIGYFDNKLYCDQLAYYFDGKWYWTNTDEISQVEIIAWKLFEWGEPYKGENYEWM